MVRGHPEVNLLNEPKETLASTLSWAEDEVFKYIIDIIENNGIRLYWQVKDISPNITHQFTIYRGIDRDGDLADWTELTTIADTWTYLDNTISLSAPFPDIVYRIKLSLHNREHTSDLVYLYGGLNPHQRNLAKAILRKLKLCQRHLPVLKGYLLKRKHTGTLCTCRDPVTKEVLNSDCQECFGTGFISGYYLQATPATLIATGPVSTIPIHDPKGQLGTVTATATQAKIAGLPPIFPYDVWVQSETNRRYYITVVKISAEISGLPLQYDVVLKMANYNDVIYQYPIEIGQ